MADAFSASRLLTVWGACAQSPNALPVELFLAGCMEVRKIAMLLGRAFGIAANDIAEKTAVVQRRADELRQSPPPPGAPPPPPVLTVQYLVESELRAGVAGTNTRSFVSASRSILRLMWLTDFIFLLLTRLVDAPDAQLSECAREAYKAALEPHHAWAVRTTIGAAMSFLPSREQFLRSLSQDPLAPAAGGGGDAAGGGGIEDKLRAFLTTQLQPVRGELWRFYTEQGLTELP
jgi:hypothetical protein